MGRKKLTDEKRKNIEKSIRFSLKEFEKYLDFEQKTDIRSFSEYARSLILKDVEEKLKYLK